MKVHNLGKEIDNLHKNIVNVKDKRVLKRVLETILVALPIPI